jgi:clan AA aspartic protease
MGLVRTKIRLNHPKRADLEAIEVDALVDTGAVHLCIPERIVIQLGLEEQEKRSVTVANVMTQVVPYVGPVRAAFGNRSCFTGAMVLGNEVLLGAIPMEDMDLVVRPLTQEVGTNPSSPNIPASVALGVRNDQR